MENSILTTLGDWNPQLLREIKGRWKFYNVALTAGLSVLIQLFLVFRFYMALPISKTNLNNYYCLTYECLSDSLGHLIINWTKWWFDLFIWMSYFGVFLLFVGGVYLLISDLSQEESRGTLNFIRMSSQSYKSVLIGKLIGVPSLLYLGVGMAIPLYLYVGISAKIPIYFLLLFCTAVIASCIFFYTTALLFALTTSWLKSFQSWLGTGVLLLFLITYSFLPFDQDNYIYTFFNNSLDWVTLFFPSKFITYLVSKIQDNPEQYKFPGIEPLSRLEFFGINLNNEPRQFFVFVITNFLISILAVWQGLKRRFPNPKIPVFTKGQSYLIAFFSILILIGFDLQSIYKNGSIRPLDDDQIYGLDLALLTLNWWITLGLAAMIIPQRQTLQEWQRYLPSIETDRKSQKLGVSRLLNLSFWQDLIWGNRSPALVAIALNIVLTSALILSLCLSVNVSLDYKIFALIGLLIYGLWLLIYAMIMQLILILPTPGRSIWAAGTTIGLWIFSVALLAVNRLDPDEYPLIGLLSPFPNLSILDATATDVAIALFIPFTILIFLVWQYLQTLKKLGESDTKMLLSKNIH